MNIKKYTHVIIIFLGLSITSVFCFRIKDHILNIFTKFNETCVNLGNAGLIGDFFGGFIGTIFAIISVYLLYSTLVSQRKESNENREVMILQQFDNVFFELLNLHKQNVENFQAIDYSGNVHKGRSFFTYQKEELKKYFVPKTSINRNRKEAIKSFEILYVYYDEEFSMFFKTLYQLYNLILNEPLTNNQKLKYAKILRAQLSNGELFFIRYNAMTEIGSNSIKFINEFHLLKHLSNIELIEFQFWTNKMDEYEKKGIYNIFKDLKHIVKNILEDHNTTQLEKTYKHGKYKFTVLSKNNYELYVSIFIDSSKNPSGLFNVNGLCKFNISQIHNLLKCALKEFIIYSNYNRFNKSNELQFTTLWEDNGVILIKVENTKKNRIKLKKNNVNTNFKNKVFEKIITLKNISKKN